MFKGFEGTLRHSEEWLIQAVRIFVLEVKSAIIKPLERYDNLAKPNRNRELVARYQSGIPPAQLEKEFGISRSRIFQILKDHAANN